MQNKKLILFLILLIIPNFSNSNIIQLSCEYEFGKGEVIINEESNKITFGPINLDYREENDKFIFELADFETKTISRHLFDLNTFQKKIIYVLLNDNEVKNFESLLDQFESGKIKYEKINNLKKKMFDKKYIDPVKFEGRKTFHFRKNEWPASDKKEYILFDNRDRPMQVMMVEFCEVKN